MLFSETFLWCLSVPSWDWRCTSLCLCKQSSSTHWLVQPSCTILNKELCLQPRQYHPDTCISILLTAESTIAAEGFSFIKEWYDQELHCLFHGAFSASSLLLLPSFLPSLDTVTSDGENHAENNMILVLTGLPNRQPATTAFYVSFAYEVSLSQKRNEHYTNTKQPTWRNDKLGKRRNIVWEIWTYKSTNCCEIAASTHNESKQVWQNNTHTVNNKNKNAANSVRLHVRVHARAHTHTHTHTHTHPHVHAHVHLNCHQQYLTIPTWYCSIPLPVM